MIILLQLFKICNFLFTFAIVSLIIFEFSGTFWERMELQDFPMDIQELSIVMQTKHNPAKVRLIPDTQKISRMNEDTLNSFRDQQKFKVSNPFLT